MTFPLVSTTLGLLRRHRRWSIPGLTGWYLWFLSPAIAAWTWKHLLDELRPGDVGLVYGVAVREGIVRVEVTLTSAACPVADLILEEIETELDRDMPPDLKIQVELVWEPPWTAERMSQSARRFMGW